MCCYWVVGRLLCPPGPRAGAATGWMYGYNAPLLSQWPPPPGTPACTPWSGEGSWELPSAVVPGRLSALRGSLVSSSSLEPPLLRQSPGLRRRISRALVVSLVCFLMPAAAVPHHCFFWSWFRFWSQFRVQWHWALHLGGGSGIQANWRLNGRPLGLPAGDSFLSPHPQLTGHSFSEAALASLGLALDPWPPQVWWHLISFSGRILLSHFLSCVLSRIRPGLCPSGPPSSELP